MAARARILSPLASIFWSQMAKDTEKLIRQLSLISYLMAERQAGHGAGDPARRGGIQRHERGRLRAALLRGPLGAGIAADPADRRAARQTGRPSRRTTRCARRTSICPAIAFSDKELAALQTALSLLDGEFAYAEPLRSGAAADHLGTAESTLSAPEQQLGRARHHGFGRRPRVLGAGWPRSRRRSSATRRSPSTTTRWERGEVGARRVDPYHLLFQGGQFYLLGFCPRARGGPRVPPDSRIRGKVSYATKAEHDFRRPGGLRPALPMPIAPTGSWARSGAWPEVLISERIAWQIERHFGRYGEIQLLHRDRTLDGEEAIDPSIAVERRRQGLLAPATPIPAG